MPCVSMSLSLKKSCPNRGYNRHSRLDWHKSTQTSELVPALHNYLLSSFAYSQAVKACLDSGVPVDQKDDEVSLFIWQYRRLVKGWLRKCQSFYLAVLSTGLGLGVNKLIPIRFEAVHTRGLGVSKMTSESSQGVLQQWVRVTTQSLDAGLCNEWCELDAGGGGQYGRL